MCELEKRNHTNLSTVSNSSGPGEPVESKGLFIYGQKLSRLIFVQYFKFHAYKNISFSTSQILLFCSYGETLSRLRGKVSGCDVALNIN